MKKVLFVIGIILAIINAAIRNEVYAPKKESMQIISSSR